MTDEDADLTADDESPRDAPGGDPDGDPTVESDEDAEDPASSTEAGDPDSSTREVRTDIAETETVVESEERDGTEDADSASPDGEPATGEDQNPALDRDVPADVDESDEDSSARQAVPDDVQKYARFKKMDGAQYDRANEFLRERTYITAREWAIARLCADFRTETGVEMTKIGENLPELVPFMEDTYTPQAVNQARAAFEEKVRKAGATFLYGAMCDFFTAEELDDLMYEVTEVAKFLLEVEGVDLSVDEELEAEDRISAVMRDVREASEALRYEECPNCGHDLRE